MLIEGTLSIIKYIQYKLNGNILSMKNWEVICSNVDN